MTRRPLYPLPRREAFKADQWYGPDTHMRELGRAERYRVDAAAIRAWRRGRIRLSPRVFPERALRERYGSYVMFALWSAMRRKAEVRAKGATPEDRVAMRFDLDQFIIWQVRDLLRHGDTIEARAAATELGHLLFLALVEPAALHDGEYLWTPRDYCTAMNDLLGVEHPFDDGTELSRHTARLEGYL